MTDTRRFRLEDEQNADKRTVATYALQKAIKTSERMPDLDVTFRFQGEEWKSSCWVLVYVHTGYDTWAWMVGCYDEKEGWKVQGLTEDYHEVSHWMPLPYPPTRTITASTSPSAPPQPGLRCNHCGTTYEGLKGPCPKCGKNTAQKLVRLPASRTAPEGETPTQTDPYPFWEVVDEGEQVKFDMDGTKWCAHRASFVNLQESLAGFGDTPMMALVELIKQEEEMESPAISAAERTFPQGMPEDAFERDLLREYKGQLAALRDALTKIRQVVAKGIWNVPGNRALERRVALEQIGEIVDCALSASEPAKDQHETGS